MSDMLMRDVDPGLKRRIKESARKGNRSLSEELKELVRRGLESKTAERAHIPPGKLGTYMFSLVPDEYRGDDLVFEVEEYPKPVEFE